MTHTSQFNNAKSPLPGIDALRAIAIIGVIFSHITPHVAVGGFVGVDVFFVISGYLIARSSVGTDLSIDLIEFWRRRISRIVPLLLIVTLITTAAAWLIFVLPKDGEDYFASLPYQAVFAQNHFFSLRRIDYFYGLEESKLNLHLWSISVEEQFYIVFPILIAGVASFPTRQRWLIAVTIFGLILLSSFLLPLSAAKFFGDPYYVMPFRAWEFALGVLVAFVTRRTGFVNVRGALILEVLALMAITIPMFSYDRTVVRYALLVPCVGAAALIFLTATRHAAILERLGLIAPIMLLGWTSYSLYLWHWPLYSFIKYTNFDFGQTWLEVLAYLVVLGILSYISYVLIEQRLRPKLNQYAFIVLALFIVANVSLAYIPKRQPNAVVSEIIESSKTTKACSGICEHGMGERVLLLWGDSHSGPLWDVAAQLADRRGLKLIGRGGWMPGRRDNPEAEEFYKYAMSLKEAGKVEAIIIAARWSMYAVGFPSFEPQEYGNRFYSRNGVWPNSQYEMTEIWKSTMDDFLKDFVGTKVIVLLQVPQFPFFPPKEMVMQELGLRLYPLPAKTVVDHRRDNTEVDQYFKKAAELNPNLKIVDSATVLCGTTECWPRQGNKVLYYDDDHLSAFGGELLTPLLESALDEAGIVVGVN